MPFYKPDVISVTDPLAVSVNVERVKTFNVALMETVSKCVVLRLFLRRTQHRDESYEAINCTSTDNQTHNNQRKMHTNTQN